MAKKIRFSLEMEQGVEVRTLEDLQEHFSLPKVLEYVKSGKIVTWLKDRYEDDLAEQIEVLNVNDPELNKKVCAIFDIEYDESLIIGREKFEERKRKLALLSNYTKEQQYIDLVDNIAFDMDDIYDLLDEDETTIYLCGTKFTIPLSKKGITYIGLNNPSVYIRLKEGTTLEDNNIVVKSVIRFDEKYLDNKKKDKPESKEKAISKVTSGVEVGSYSKDSFLNFMLSPKDKQESEQTYNNITKELCKLTYDVDADVKDMKKKIVDAGLVGLAENYINSL